MASWLIGVIVVAALFVIVLVALTAVRMQRRRRLRRQFGPEYDRTVDERGRRKAENELAQRAERREQVDLKPLAPEARRLYAASWEQVQARFVDAPADAVQEADVLVAKVMRDCGYPVDGFDDRSDFVSVDHPHLVEDYRAAHRTAVADTGGTVSTEDRRQAMVHFRSLFEALLDDQHDMTDRRTG
ncbi:MAG: hypothetical protein JOZ68_17795 [Acidimicrobiia bacterium]|nr:hypothetical protein [Acidimicrobiia bacterium]